MGLGDWMPQPVCPWLPSVSAHEISTGAPTCGATIWWLEDWAPHSHGMTVEKGQSQLAKYSSSCYYNTSNNLLRSFPGGLDHQGRICLQ